MHTSSERRQCVANDLVISVDPVSASTLARQYGVSRQVIVGDIAILRATGLNIQSTPRGYVLQRELAKGYTGTVACRHSRDQMQAELYTITDLGGSLHDVIIDHPIYGQLVAQLQINSRFDADLFLNKVNDEQIQLLSHITDGVHLHTIHCPDEMVFRRIVAALDQQGLLYQNE